MKTNHLFYRQFARQTSRTLFENRNTFLQSRFQTSKLNRGHIIECRLSSGKNVYWYICIIGDWAVLSVFGTPASSRCIICKAHNWLLWPDKISVDLLNLFWKRLFARKQFKRLPMQNYYSFVCLSGNMAIMRNTWQYLHKYIEYFRKRRATDKSTFLVCR